MKDIKDDHVAVHVTDLIWRLSETSKQCHAQMKLEEEAGKVHKSHHSRMSGMAQIADAVITELRGKIRLAKCETREEELEVLEELYPEGN